MLDCAGWRKVSGNRTEVEKDASGKGLLDSDGCGLLQSLVVGCQYAPGCRMRAVIIKVPRSRPCFAVEVLGCSQYGAQKMTATLPLTEHCVYVK